MPYYTKYLNDYRVIKLTRVFNNIIDMDGNGHFDDEDIDCLLEKMRKHSGSQRDDEFFKQMKKMSDGFLAEIREFVERHKGKLRLD